MGNEDIGKQAPDGKNPSGLPQSILVRSVPSFKGLHPASDVSSHIKQHNRSTDSQAEILLRRELWQRGYRFRKNVAYLPGKPDIVFQRHRVAIFCDGDFWHGRQWGTLQPKLKQGTNAAYWVAKIASNRERDLRTNHALEALGWKVLRLWETDIKANVRDAAERVANLLDPAIRVSHSKDSAHEIH